MDSLHLYGSVGEDSALNGPPQLKFEPSEGPVMAAHGSVSPACSREEEESLSTTEIVMNGPD
jgi:hypothetical protein